MNREPVDYELVMKYLDDSAPYEDRRQAREYLLQSTEARAFVREVVGQIVHLIDQHSANMPLAGEFTGDATRVLAVSEEKGLEKKPSRMLVPILAASVLVIAGLLLAPFTIFRGSNAVEGEQPSIQLTGYQGELSVSHGPERLKSPLQKLPRVYVGDSVETHSWFSWGELKLESGTVLTLLVNSRVNIKSLTRERMELDLVSGAVRISAAKDDPMEFVVHSDRLNVSTRGSDTLVWDFIFVRAMVASFAGSAEVTAAEDETLKTWVRPGEMASIGYNDVEIIVGPHPTIVNNWSSVGMKSTELGTGLWKEPAGPELVKLLAAPKTYIFKGGVSQQIEEVMVGVWRRPGMVGLKAGSRLIVSGKYEKESPITFSLRTHSEYGKFLDLFNKTVPPVQLAPAGRKWRVEIPLEEMQSVFRPGQDPTGALLFNISIYSYEAIGLEVNSVELRPPD